MKFCCVVADAVGSEAWPCGARGAGGRSRPAALLPAGAAVPGALLPRHWRRQHPSAAAVAPAYPPDQTASLGPSAKAGAGHRTAGTSFPDRAKIGSVPTRITHALSIMRGTCFRTAGRPCARRTDRSWPRTFQRLQPREVRYRCRRRKLSAGMVGSTCLNLVRSRPARRAGRRLHACSGWPPWSPVRPTRFKLRGATILIQVHAAWEHEHAGVGLLDGDIAARGDRGVVPLVKGVAGSHPGARVIVADNERGATAAASPARVS